MSETTTATPNVADVEEAMRDVVDPELGINVVDLGLVYGITVDAQKHAVLDMTLTSAACPLTDVIEDQTAAGPRGPRRVLPRQLGVDAAVGPRQDHRRRPRAAARPRLQPLSPRRPADPGRESSRSRPSGSTAGSSGSPPTTPDAESPQRVTAREEFPHDPFGRRCSSGAAGMPWGWPAAAGVHRVQGRQAARPVAHRRRRLVPAALRPATGQPGRRAGRARSPSTRCGSCRAAYPVVWSSAATRRWCARSWTTRGWRTSTPCRGASSTTCPTPGATSSRTPCAGAGPFG